MIKKLASWWKSQPKVRFYCRTVLTAAAAYVATWYGTGSPFSWKDLIGAGIGALIHAGVGFLTPLEPFVGVKPKNVEVPTPPAGPER